MDDNGCDAKELLLTDAIETAIELQRLSRRQRTVILILSFIDMALVSMLIAMVVGG